MLRNTRWIVGLVLNTGPDTKIVMSSLEVTIRAFDGCVFCAYENPCSFLYMFYTKYTAVGAICVSRQRTRLILSAYICFIMTKALNCTVVCRDYSQHVCLGLYGIAVDQRGIIAPWLRHNRRCHSLHDFISSVCKGFSVK